jgi:inner membrane protein involved in colicin E2 resistance
MSMEQIEFASEVVLTIIVCIVPFMLIWGLILEIKRERNQNNT